MITKILKSFSILIIVLFSLSVYGWMVKHIEKGDKKFGLLTKPVKSLYAFPELFKKSVEEVKTLPKTFVKTPENFEAINRLENDVVALITYSDKNNTRSIDLINLRNDSVLHHWSVKNPFKKDHHRIVHPILLANNHIIYSFMGKAIHRIDAESNLVWKQDRIESHHSMNFDDNGDLWICSYDAKVWISTGYYDINGKTIFYLDQYITKIDPETGNKLFHKSIADILKENNLSNYLIKSANTKDPIHLNDVQPALKTTQYYNKGDLFLSLRQPSIVIHYRPETNKVIDIIEGPFVSQHDVDFYENNALVLFNNNSHTLGNKESMKPPRDSSKLIYSGNFHSDIIKYDFESKSSVILHDSLFKAHELFTHTEGLMEYLAPNTIFVEEQNSGVLWIFENNKVIYKNVLQSQHEGYHHLPNWTRIIKDYE